MRRIIVSAFVSLDGVMQAPGGPDEDRDSGFKFGGWVAPFFDDTVNQAMDAFPDRPYDLLLGRKTYDIFASYWPQVTDRAHPNIAIANAFNAAAKYVATRSSPPLPWNNSRNLGADVVAALKALKAADGPDLAVQGSADFLQTLWKHGLVDEFTTLTFPVVLGKGKRLFEEGVAPCSLTVTKSVASPSGVVIATYRPDGPVRTGDFTDPDSL